MHCKICYRLRVFDFRYDIITSRNQNCASNIITRIMKVHLKVWYDWLSGYLSIFGRRAL